MGTKRGGSSVPNKAIFLAIASFIGMGTVAYSLLILCAPTIWPSFIWMLFCTASILVAFVLSIHRSEVQKEESALTFLREVVVGLQREDSLRVDKREREVFLSSIEHELRTPLTTVHGFSKALLESDSNQNDRDALRFIHQGAEKLRVVLDRILLSHKIFLDSDIQKKALIRPSRYIPSIFQHISDSAQTFEQSVITHIEDESTYRVFCDPESLTHVMSVLASQVFEYNKSNSPITLSFSIENSFAVFSFIWSMEENDLGLSIPRIRDLSSDEFKANELGTGVVIAGKFASLHDGELDFIPLPDGRTSLRFRIPCMNDYEEDEECLRSSMH